MDILTLRNTLEAVELYVACNTSSDVIVRDLVENLITSLDNWIRGSTGDLSDWAVAVSSINPEVSHELASNFVDLLTTISSEMYEEVSGLVQELSFHLLFDSK